MKNKSDQCDPALLSRFLDQELTAEEHAWMDKHLARCSICRSELAQYRTISQTFQAATDSERHRGQLAAIERTVLQRVSTRPSWRERLQDWLFSRRILVPATAMAVAATIFFSAQNYFSDPEVPSALVTSMQGDVASIMIVETPKSHQTIIWITENS